MYFLAAYRMKLFWNEENFSPVIGCAPIKVIWLVVWQLGRWNINTNSIVGTVPIHCHTGPGGGLSYCSAFWPSHAFSPLSRLSVMSICHIHLSCLSIMFVHHVRPSCLSVMSVHQVCLSSLSVTPVCHVHPSRPSAMSIKTVCHVCPSRPSFMSVHHVGLSHLSVKSVLQVCL